MNCPLCETPMIEGQAELHGTFWSWVWVGASYEMLFFRPKGAKEWERPAALASGQRADAHRCNICGGVFVQQPPWTPGYR